MRSTRMLGRFGPRWFLFVATSLTFAGGLVVTSSAEAASATYIPQTVSCLVIQQSPHVPNNTGYPLLQGLLDDSVPAQNIADIVTIPRPASVADFRGTANLYWAPVVRLVDNQTGASAQVLATKYHAYSWPYVWLRNSAGGLTNLWWGNDRPLTQTQIDLPPGYTVYVWGKTYWLNKSGPYLWYQSQYLGKCSA
jgi:hypothetical protein